MRFVSPPLFPKGITIIEKTATSDAVKLQHTVIIDFQGDHPRLNMKFNRPVLIGKYRIMGLKAISHVERSTFRCTYDSYQELVFKDQKSS